MIQIIRTKASSFGLGGDYFSGTIHLDQKPGGLFEFKLTWHCCNCCNPAKGRVYFEDSWLIKSSFITKDEMKLVS